MRLVETVTGELLNLVENGVSRLFVNLVHIPAALHETAALFGHFLHILVTHGSAQKVSTTQGVAGQQLGCSLHLLLVNHHAVGKAGHRLQQRVLVFRLLQPLLHGNHVVHELHGAGAVKSEQSDDIFNIVDTVASAGVHHTAGFQLEHAHGITAVQQLESLLVGNIHRVVAEIRHAPAHVAFRILHHREGLQPQEVHLQQAGVINGAHITLGHHFTLRVTQVISGEGHVFIQRAVTNHHTGGVHAYVSHRAFQLLGVVPDFAVGVILFHQVAQVLTGGITLIQCHAGTAFDELGNLVAVAVAHIQHAGHVLDNRFGTHGTVGDDVRHGAFTVFVAHVVNHFRSAGLAEVDINIRGAHTLRVQESFENEVEGVGVDVCDFHHIGHQRTGGRTTARAHGNIVVLCPVNEVCRDEEVAWEAQLVNDAQLVIQTRAQLLVILGALLAVALF